MCVHDRELEAARRRQEFRIAEYRPERPASRLCGRCGADCPESCRECWTRQKPAEEGREDDER
jgi:hypothetical protein